MILQLLLVLEVAFRLAAGGLVQRRLSDENMTALDELRHLAVKEGKQKRPDMGPVHVGVGHDDDFVVAQLIGIDLLPSDAGAKRRNQVYDRFAGKHLVKAR